VLFKVTVRSGTGHIKKTMPSPLLLPAFVQVPFFPPLQSSESFTTDVCRQLLAEAIGTADSKSESLLADLEIHSIRPWTMHAEVAQRMRQVEDSSRCIRFP
jgi:hypothetical protein